MQADTATIILATATIIVAVIGTRIGLAIAIMPSLRELRRKVDELGRDHGERLARIEAILQS